jgi:hypothetical protein
MACLSDLSPEIRLKIYQLLLIDPIRKGLRITYEPDLHGGNKLRQVRPRGYQSDEAHSPCRLYCRGSTLHHLDFTDLMSLAMTNRKLYAEASQTIYNNADLTLTFDLWSPTATPTFASTLFSRYLRQHCSLTREMFLSLTILDEVGIMSLKDAGSIVALVNAQLPNLRSFEYYNFGFEIDHMSRLAPYIPFDMDRFRCNYSRAVRAIEPFAGFGGGVRTTLDMPVPNSASSHIQTYSLLCRLRQKFIEKALQPHTLVHQYRANMRRSHATALEYGCYLEITGALRSTSIENVQFDESLTVIEKMLVDMHNPSDHVHSHRYLPRLLRGESGTVDVDVVLARGKKTQMSIIMDQGIRFMGKAGYRVGGEDLKVLSKSTPEQVLHTIRLHNIFTN